MNMIGQSQSGTGKTAAFVLNILSRLDLMGDMKATPQALVLAPSRELARQIVGVIQVMGMFIDGLDVATSVPLESQRNQKVVAPIVVGTPGTVMDQIKRKLFNPSKLKVLVLDEADNMLDQQGMGEQCIRVKAYVLCGQNVRGDTDFTHLDSCQKRSRLSFSLLPSPTTSSAMRQNSLLTLTSSLSSMKSSPSRVLDSSTLTVKAMSINMRCLSSFTVFSPLARPSFSSRYIINHSPGVSYLLTILDPPICCRN